jgi:hypothetical protein
MPQVRNTPVALRRSRAAVFAGTVASLAIAAHAAAGGGRPNLGTVLVVTALIAIAASAFVGRRNSAFAVAGALAGAQLSMHLILDAAPAHHDPSAAPMASGWAMLAAHVIATGHTAVLMATADHLLSAAWAAVRAILHVVRPFVLTPPVTSTVRPVPPRAVDVVLQVLLRTSCARRGPPSPRANG